MSVTDIIDIDPQTEREPIRASLGATLVEAMDVNDETGIGWDARS